MTNRAVFLDRDGVINPLVYNTKTEAFESPKKLSDFTVFSYVPDALRSIRGSGYLIFIVSNQPDAAKGKADIRDLMQIEQFFADYSERNGGLVDGAHYCHHHPEGVVPEYARACGCRKPGTLFLEQARSKYDIDLSESWFVGDRATDILCGSRAGCRTIRIAHANMQADAEEPVTPNATVPNLLAAAKHITGVKHEIS